MEFALVIPLFLLLFLAMVEFGRAWMTRNLLTGAAREAARVLAISGDMAQAQARADNVLLSASITTATVSLAIDNTSTDPYRPVTVTVSYNMPMIVGWVAGFVPGITNGRLPLSSTTVMRLENP